jgi:hypothetical protein
MALNAKCQCNTPYVRVARHAVGPQKTIPAAGQGDGTSPHRGRTDASVFQSRIREIS